MRRIAGIALLVLLAAAPSFAADPISNARAAVTEQMGSPSGLEFRGERVTSRGEVCGEVTDSNAAGDKTGSFVRYIFTNHGYVLLEKGDLLYAFAGDWSRDCE
jgi:hypothetical protein